MSKGREGLNVLAKIFLGYLNVHDRKKKECRIKDVDDSKQ
jgi:hypothetical protein